MTPTAVIAVNKSRIKLYNKNTDSPTYYLQKGQEFEIELFNPTQETILAKIILNNKPLSQGGLVLRPGERVFVERYLDVPKKFLFDTYEVSDSKEVQKAIEKNGDFKVQFFKEQIRNTININTGTFRGFTTINNLVNGNCTYSTTTLGNTSLGISTTSTANMNTIDSAPDVRYRGIVNTSNSAPIVGGASGNISTSSTNFCNTSASMDWMQQEMERTLDIPQNKKQILARSASPKKTVETGRVEKGSDSDQKIKQVQMDFSPFAFHTVEAKLLPISQKISTSKDLNVRQYCTNCGHKASKGDKFCSSCGTKM
jgi:hypothetical protein